jgi:hypothetical protein
MSIFQVRHFVYQLFFSVKKSRWACAGDKNHCSLIRRYYFVKLKNVKNQLYRIAEFHS